MDTSKTYMNLTICIPVYNRTEYFLDALESALTQTSKCEIMVVDNCSDTSYFEEHCSKKKVRYVRGATHVSMFENWNRCFQYAETEFVLILGDDDVLEKDYVETFNGAIQEYPNIQLYYTNYYLIYNDEKPNKDVKAVGRLPFGYRENGRGVLEYGAQYGLSFPTISCVIRKDIFNGYYTAFHASNDWLWVYSNISDLIIFGSPEYKVYYRKHQGADTSKSETKVREFLSHSYIYSMVIAKKVTDAHLQRMAQRRAMHMLISLKFADVKNQSMEIALMDNIYSDFFRQICEEKVLIKLLFSLPPFLVQFLKKLKW